MFGVSFIEALFFGLQQPQFRRQARLLKQTVGSNERLQHACIVLDGIRIQRNRPSYADSAWIVSVRLRNVGLTLAKLESLTLKLADKSALPAKPDYAGGVSLSLPQGLTADKASIVQGACPAPTNDIDREKPVRFVAYGRVTYLDISGNRHHTGFAVEVSPHTLAAKAIADDKYNYVD